MSQLDSKFERRNLTFGTTILQRLSIWKKKNKKQKPKLDNLKSENKLMNEYRHIPHHDLIVKSISILPEHV